MKNNATKYMKIKFFLSNSTRGIIFIIYLLSLFSSIDAQIKTKPLLGNYIDMKKYHDPWMRSGHINADLMVQRLTELGANTYMWCIETPYAWDDLKIFLPKAKMAGISVWVYLRPPLASPPYGAYFSEPYRLDFVSWAREIAKLSLRYSNLRGYSIDDFWTDTYPYNSKGIFTESYINRFVSEGKAINPNIKFYPILYFSFFLRPYEPQPYDMLYKNADGIIAPYPGWLGSDEKLIGPMADTTAISRGVGILAARCRSRVLVTLPVSTTTAAGDGGSVYQNVRVTNPSKATLTFHYTYGGTTNTDEYHRFQVRVDDKIVWWAGLKYAYDNTVTIDITNEVAGKERVKISLGVFENKGVGNFAFTGSMDLISASGLDLNTNLGDETAWTKEIRGGKFNVQLVPSLNKTLPLIVMPAADSTQYTLRFNDPATPENVSRRINSYTKYLLNGQIEGIINFQLDMNTGSRYFNAVRDVFIDTKRKIE